MYWDELVVKAFCCSAGSEGTGGTVLGQLSLHYSSGLRCSWHSLLGYYCSHRSIVCCCCYGGKQTPAGCLQPTAHRRHTNACADQLKNSQQCVSFLCVSWNKEHGDTMCSVVLVCVLIRPVGVVHFEECLS